MAITFLKLNIFWRDFFQKISTLCETHESGDFQDILALSGGVYSPKQWSSKIGIFRFIKILRTQIWKQSLKWMKTLGNEVFRSGWYWNSITQSENKLNTNISVRNSTYRIVYFLWIFREVCILPDCCFGLYLTAEGQNVLEIARFVRFRECRYF